MKKRLTRNNSLVNSGATASPPKKQRTEPPATKSASPTRFAQLPGELIYYIFSYTPNLSTLAALNCLSKTIHEVISQEQFFALIYFAIYYPDEDTDEDSESSSSGSDDEDDKSSKASHKRMNSHDWYTFLLGPLQQTKPTQQQGTEGSTSTSKQASNEDKLHELSKFKPNELTWKQVCQMKQAVEKVQKTAYHMSSKYSKRKTRRSEFPIDKYAKCLETIATIMNMGRDCVKFFKFSSAFDDDVMTTVESLFYVFRFAHVEDKSSPIHQSAYRSLLVQAIQSLYVTHRRLMGIIHESKHDFIYEDVQGYLKEMTARASEKQIQVELKHVLQLILTMAERVEEETIAEFTDRVFAEVHTFSAVIMSLEDLSDDLIALLSVAVQICTTLLNLIESWDLAEEEAEAITPFTDFIREILEAFVGRAKQGKTETPSIEDQVAQSVHDNAQQLKLVLQLCDALKLVPETKVKECLALSAGKFLQHLHQLLLKSGNSSTIASLLELKE